MMAIYQRLAGDACGEWISGITEAPVGRHWSLCGRRVQGKSGGVVRLGVLQDGFGNPSHGKFAAIERSEVPGMTLFTQRWWSRTTWNGL
jgi:hypothetical protein